MSDAVAEPDEVSASSRAARERDLTQGSIPQHMVRLTGFMMLSMISFNLASLIEALYIGRLGTAELAAISFTFPVIYTLQGVSMGLGVGASSVVARTIGTGDMVRVKRLITHCVLLGTAVSILLAWGSHFFLRDIFALLGADKIVLDLVVDYMAIWLYGMPVFTMTFVGTTLMRAIGDAKTPGYLSTLGSVLHVAIAPFLIFGIGPFPALGLEGAAISFIVARVIGFLFFIYCFVFRDQLLGYSLDGFRQSCREILHVGLPAMASNMIMPFSMTIVTRLLASHGTAVVAGFGVATRIESMLVMVIWAVGMSIAPFVGQNWGAGHFDRVRDAIRLGNIFVLAWGAFSYLLLLALGDWFVSLINDDPEVVIAAYHYLIIAPIAVGFMGVGSIAASSFNALGKPIPPLIISILQMIVINIPLILLGNYLWGYRGMFIGGVITTVSISCVAWWWILYTIKSRAGKALRRESADAG